MELVVDNLAVARGGVPVLEGVSFTLKPGQVLMLRGPNGSGKTTLLRSLAGLQEPLAGTVSIPPEAITYGAHADGLKSTLSVAENLTFWARIYGTKDITDALQLFNLTGLAGRLAMSLSAGQKRRIGLARLLLTGRNFWLLDEPTVSLDTASVSLFADAVRAHVARGGAALIASHIDMGLAAEVLDITNFRADPDAPGALATGFDEAFT